MDGGRRERVEIVRHVAPVVDEHGRQDRLALRVAVQPPLLHDDVVREDGMVHAVRVAKSVVASQLLVAARVVQERGRVAHARRLGVESLARRDRAHVLHHVRRVNALEPHHRRQFAVRPAKRVDIGVV